MRIKNAKTAIAAVGFCLLGLFGSAWAAEPEAKKEEPEPKGAAFCITCHDSSKAMGHVTSFGGSAFGDKTQAQIAAPTAAKETCDDCHASGGFKGVDTVHDQK